jgi:alkylation response protein AidB-like acyl-CoA dehydrogenase
LSPFNEQLQELESAVALATGEHAKRHAFRGGFQRLRGTLDLHPAGRTAATTFDAAASTTARVAEASLPLGIALVMHLYPLCVLRWVPLPWWTRGGHRRNRLLALIDEEELILANAGGERAGDGICTVTVSREPDGVRANGTFDYVSLASVADLVLFSAPATTGDHVVFCAAEMRRNAVSIGESRFDGRMWLSDTHSVSFEDHFVATSSSIEVPTPGPLSTMAQYQRSWCQLLLGECYLARAQRLEAQWALPGNTSRKAALNELRMMKLYARHLLDTASSASAIEELAKVSAAIKLKVSWLAQETAAALKPLDPDSAKELGFLRLQPTADDRILQSLEPARRDYVKETTRAKISNPIVTLMQPDTRAHC